MIFLSFLLGKTSIQQNYIEEQQHMRTILGETKSALDMVSALNLKSEILRMASRMLTKHGTL